MNIKLLRKIRNLCNYKFDNTHFIVSYRMNVFSFKYKLSAYDIDGNQEYFRGYVYSFMKSMNKTRLSKFVLEKLKYKLINKLFKD